MLMLNNLALMVFFSLQCFEQLQPKEGKLAYSNSRVIVCYYKGVQIPVCVFYIICAYKQNIPIRNHC